MTLDGISGSVHPTVRISVFGERGFGECHYLYFAEGPTLYLYHKRRERVQRRLEDEETLNPVKRDGGSQVV